MKSIGRRLDRLESDIPPGPLVTFERMLRQLSDGDLSAAIEAVETVIAGHPLPPLRPAVARMFEALPR